MDISCFHNDVHVAQRLLVQEMKDTVDFIAFTSPHSYELNIRSELGRQQVWKYVNFEFKWFGGGAGISIHKKKQLQKQT